MDNKIEKKEYKNIRLSAFAGQFYPANKSVLEEKINKYLKNIVNVDKPAPGENNEVAAILVPHAGYDYSGQVAAYAYKLLQGRSTGTVFLLANAHSVGFNGAALDDNEAWETPLGLLELDSAKAQKIVESDPRFIFYEAAHTSDHTLEVQLPFLQKVLRPGFKIVPILFGLDHDLSAELAAALENVMEPQDIIVVSSDLSHYPEYYQANEIDQATLGKIAGLDIDDLLGHISETEARKIPNEQTCACGLEAVKTAMIIAKNNNWQAEILNYANSGDSLLGSKEKVVGYGAIVFRQARQNINILNENQKKELLRVARESVEAYVKNGEKLDFEIADERLNQQAGAFVTLKADNQLRGCIGRILPGQEPLYETVQEMAIAAASDDPRFSPLAAEELSNLDYEISVLSAPQKINDWQKIELGRHGVIVRKGFKSGVFLPQVALETGWTLEEFLAELCSQKAGLERDAYKNDPKVELLVFSAQVF